MNVQEGIRNTDEPYNNFVSFSKDGIRGITSVISTDPGTGFVKDLRAKTKKIYGDDYEVWKPCGEYLGEGELKKLLMDEFKNWFGKAKEFVEMQVTKNQNEPVSTSILFAYFLWKNKGLIADSLWDTTLWLKVAARNDLDTLEWKPTRESTDWLLSIFKDESSPAISANWVAKNVEPDDAMLNVTDHQSNLQYKDFMPLNRSGLYHSWNATALCSTMEAEMVKRAISQHVTGFYTYKEVERSNGKVGTEYGRERTIGDLMVIDRADEMQKIIEMFEVG